MDSVDNTVDLVNHPSHYRTQGVECIAATRGMCNDLGNAVKYVYRAWDKGHPAVDLRKARWYLDDFMRHLDAQHHPMSMASCDALRLIAAANPAKSLTRLFFYSISDGRIGDAMDHLNEMIGELDVADGR